MRPDVIFFALLNLDVIKENAVLAGTLVSGSPECDQHILTAA